LLDIEQAAFSKAEIRIKDYDAKSDQQLGQSSVPSPCKCSTCDQAALGSAAEASQSMSVAGKRCIIDKRFPLQL
jgi:hypothetical protein